MKQSISLKSKPGSLKSKPGKSVFPLSSKGMAAAGVVCLAFLASACHYHGGGLSLVPGPNHSAAVEPAAVAAESQPALVSPVLQPRQAVKAVGSEDLIAADLVNAVVQIDKLHPSRLNLKMDDRPTTFSATLKFVLEQAGYDFSSIPVGDQYATVVVKVRDLDRKRSGLYRRYQIEIGEVKFRREYFIQPQGVTPSSDLLVKGVDASRIVLNEDIFADPAGPAIQPAAVMAENVSLNSTAQTQHSAPLLVEAGNNSLPTVATAGVISPLDIHGHIDHNGEAAHAVHDPFKIMKNRFALGHSNFAKLTENFIEVKSQVLVFANDSLNLGRNNKASILSFTVPFVEESDVISIIGCSHGRTSIPNGNVVLSTGRAQRVKEAFLIAGIAEDRILEEGCWSATEVDIPHPSRGVIVTLKREPRNG